MHDRDIPSLSVVTRSFPDAPEDLLELCAADAPVAWLRGGDGLVGIGVAARADFDGPGRFREAKRWWADVVDAARVDDAVGVSGSGLVAFGTFAFSARSGRSSTLIVPRVIVGRRGATVWSTHIGSEDPARRPGGGKPATWAPVAFHAGAMDETSYSHAVESALERISSQQVEKVVLARSLEAPLPPHADLRAPLARLASGYPDCWTFAVDGMLGSTPEMLASVDSGTVRARVLAGSTARGVDAASDRAASLALVTSEKDRDEHGYAVRSVLAALAPHTSSLVASEIPFALGLPNLWHLASDVDGCLADASTSLDLVDALHPTAAVAGSPTAAALDVIAELEPFDRGRYAGPVGWIGADGDGQWAIALRCAQVDERTITAYAGAGVVAGSQPAKELAETAMKFRPVLDAFG